MAYVEVMCGQTRDDELERGGDVAGQSGTARILAGVHRQWLRRAGRLSTDRLTRPRCYRRDVACGPRASSVGSRSTADSRADHEFDVVRQRQRDCSSLLHPREPGHDDQQLDDGR